MSAGTTTSNQAIISAGGIVKRWGSTLALDGLTVDILPGVTSLLGANGSGKTTFMGLVLGLHRPDDGQLNVFDRSASDPTIRARIGYSPEHHTLPPDIKSVDFVRLIGELHGLPRREAMRRSSDVLWQVGLGEERSRPLGTMSTGQRQRVKLAQAIVHDPLLVLLDEPTEGLDPVQRDDMLSLIRRIGTEFGLSILISSHVLDEVERVADRAVMMHAGRVVGNGTLDELRATSHAGVVVDVINEADAIKVSTVLAARNVNYQISGAWLHIPAPDQLNSNELFDLARDAIATADVSIRRLEPRRQSLEEAFLSAGLLGGQASAVENPVSTGGHA